MNLTTLYVLLAFIVGCAIGPWIEAVAAALCERLKLH